MIKFFRTIRKSLLNEGKTSRYFKYAIGEIVLVMIGILLALQVNNWNEERKSDAFELKMLSEIEKSLRYDKYYLKAILKERIIPVDSTCQILFKLLSKEKVDMAEFNKNAKNINTDFVFEYDDGAYETIKSTGLNSIKNDLLRDELKTFYDFWAPRTKNLIDIHNNYTYRMKSDELTWEIFDYVIVKNGTKYMSQLGDYKLKNPKDELFLKYLTLKGSKAYNAITRINGYIELTDDLIEKLNQEFKNRNYVKLKTLYD